MTIEAWVNPTALSGWRTVALKGMPGGLAYALYAHDNAPRPAGYGDHRRRRRVRGRHGRAAAQHVDSSRGDLWRRNAAALRQRRPGRDSERSPERSRTSPTPLTIGGNAVWGEWFAGLIDEVRIYNRALTQAEIQAGMTQTLGGG